MRALRRRLMMSGSKKDFSKVPFYSHALEDGVFTFNILVDKSDITQLSYAINDPTFTDNLVTTVNEDSKTVQVVVPVQEGDVVYWKGLGDRYNNNTPNYNDDVFESTGLYEVGGNLMSLVCPDVSSFIANIFPDVVQTYCFRNFFRNETNLVSCDNLVIPVSTCKEEGCKRLFYGCSSLVNPIKVLPATTIEKQCYMSMFGFCSNLTSGPELPARTLAQQCYEAMFQGCTSLTTAELPVIPTWTPSACKSMFYDCSELSYVKALIKNIAADMTSNWMKGVKNEPECIFVKNIDAVWTTTGDGGVPSNWTLIYFSPSTGKYYLSDKTTECDDHGNVI